jgi:hypothetical protein
MLMSPLLLWARVGIQKPFGVYLLMSFFVTLTAPYCYAGIRSALVGCFAWMGSFAASGLGFVLFSMREEQLTPTVPMAVSPASSRGYPE